MTYQNPPMPKWRVDQLTRKQVRLGARIGTLCVCFMHRGYAVMHDDGRRLSDFYADREGARAEMRRLAAQEGN